MNSARSSYFTDNDKLAVNDVTGAITIRKCGTEIPNGGYYHDTHGRGTLVDEYGATIFGFFTGGRGDYRDSYRRNYSCYKLDDAYIDDAYIFRTNWFADLVLMIPSFNKEYAETGVNPYSLGKIDIVDSIININSNKTILEQILGI